MKIATTFSISLLFLLVIPTMAQVQPQIDVPHETPGVVLTAPTISPATFQPHFAPTHVKVADKKFWLIVGLEFAATAADLETTRWAINSRPGAYESNPMFGRRPSRLRQYGIGIPITAVSVGLQYRAKRQAALTGRHKYTWWIASLPVTGLHTFLAYHNAGLVP